MLRDMRRRGRVRERIIRVLLNEPDGVLSKYRVSKEAGCSFSWVHEYLKKLEGLGLIDGTRVVDYRGLVENWRKIRKKPEREEYLHRSPLDLLKKAGLQYALTTYQAENLVQHYLFPSRTDVYIKRVDRDFWHKLVSEGGLVGKGNLRLLMDDEHVFYGSSEQKGLKVASLPQVIVDLFVEGGVCVEAAEMLLQKVEKGVVRTI